MFKFLQSKTANVIAIYLGIFLVITDYRAGMYGWAIFMAILTLLNVRSYRIKAKMEREAAEAEKEEKKEPETPKCPPHQWDMKDGHLCCGKCKCDPHKPRGN